MGTRAKKRERMLELVSRWRRSGESAAAFCRRAGVSAKTFSYWKRIALQARSTRRARPASEARPFVPVRVVDEAPRALLEVAWPGGLRVVAYDAEQASELLALARERC